jgi:YVTN family beta-propeller protein
MRRVVALSALTLLAVVLGTASSMAQKAYITNDGSNTVSVIATASNTVVDTITVGNGPGGVAVSPDGGEVYVANAIDNTVSVIATATNTVVGNPITVGGAPSGVAVTPDGSKVYVTNFGSNTVSVIATASNTVTATVTVGTEPVGVAVTPDGSKVYVANPGSNTVSVIATASNTVIGSPITAGGGPRGIAVTPDGSKVYAANYDANTVSVIATASNTVVDTITVGTGPAGVAVTPDGSKIYVANRNSNNVSAIATASNTVIATVTVGNVPSNPNLPANPFGVAVTPDGSKVYVANFGLTTVSVIATASDTVIGSPIYVGGAPEAFGNFIGPPTLTVAEAGTGSGQVTSSPANINCSASSNACAAMFPNGTQVTLTASAAAGSAFAGWSGGGCSGTSTCVITPTSDSTVTATFNQVPSLMLSVTPSGTGSGTVTSSPSGINCGATCQASFGQGTQVTLTASAASGSTFAGWSGGGCSGVAACTVTLAANTTVTANFVQNTAGNLTLVAAVLPLSRSVQVGATPTAFATILNAGPDNASNCTIAPATSIPASFLFQTTDPTTNALTGTANTPANIAAGQAQSFVIAFTPNAAFAPTNVAFTFTCANAPSPAVTTIGVDTLNLSASTTPVPDIVALAASGDPGYVDIPGATGTGVFAVATVNLGSDATITASANTGSANLPVTLTVCQTNPTSGACLANPAASAGTDIQPNATPTFGIFVAGGAAVANMPGVNRVFVTFIDASGVLRGETSVAVRTQ